MWFRHICLQKLAGIGSGGRLVEVDVGNNRRADKQRALVRIVVCKVDPNRQSLHHLDEVARSVFRRQQRQRRSGPLGKAGNAPLEHAAVAIHVDIEIDRLAADAPDVKQAEAKLEVAKRDLDQAQLDLRYCDVIAEIDGVITRRNVNPGDNIQVGQALMAIRSLDEIWVDANFKETQLGDLRIGQPVDLYVDMYGDRHVFKGRISGFTEGTGSTLALLPAENATGNFIKVVQRLPVRIDLENYDPDKSPLFVGTSVVPYVLFKEPPTGPDAGKLLQTSAPGPTANPPGAKK